MAFLHIFSQLVHVAAIWCFLHQYHQGVCNDAPCSEHDQGCKDARTGWICIIPLRNLLSIVECEGADVEWLNPDEEGGNDDTNCLHKVPNHVYESCSDVQIPVFSLAAGTFLPPTSMAVPVAPQDTEHKHVHQQAKTGNPEHQRALNLLGSNKPHNRLVEEDASESPDQEHTHQGTQHLSTSVPESETFGGDTLSQLDCCDGDKHARDIGKQVCCVGQNGERICEEASNNLNDHE